MNEQGEGFLSVRFLGDVIEDCMILEGLFDSLLLDTNECYVVLAQL